MSIPKLTLDTNLLIELWKHQKKARVVKSLIKLANDGKVDLIVTRRITDDIPKPELSLKLNELPELGIDTSGSVARLGSWVLGVDMLGSGEFSEFEIQVNEIVEKSGRKPPDWRDWDHLHSHFLQGRDYFLTWDKGILRIADELEKSFGIIVIKPEDFIKTING